MTLTKTLARLVTVLGFLILSPLGAKAAAGPGTFSYEGRLYDLSGNPSTLTVSLTLGIYNPAGNCLLRQEHISNLDLSLTNGYFSVDVGNSANLSSQDPGLSMSAVFANRGAITGAGGCSYIPAAGDGRILRIILHDGNTAVTLSPDVSIGAAPYALVADTAETVQGKLPTDFLQVNATELLTQGNLESLFGTNAKLAEMQALANGTSNRYAPMSSAAGLRIAPVAGAPSTPVAGSMWFDTSSHQIKFYDGTSAVAVGNVGGSVTGVTGTAPITIGGTSTAAVVGISQAGASTDGYLSSGDWHLFNGKLGSVLASGKVFVGNANNVANPVTPSGDVSLSTAGVFSVTKIQGTAVSTLAPNTAGQVLRYDGTSTLVPSLLSVSDVSGLVNALGNKVDASQLPASCASNQTLTFSSPSNAWSCSNIAITGAAFGSQSANLVLAAPGGGSGIPTFRALVPGDIPALDASKVVSGTLAVSQGGTGSANGSITGSGALTFAAGGSNQNVMLVPSGLGAVIMNGNVGIGTTSPAAALDVAGQIKSSVFNAGSGVTIDWNNGNNQYTAPGTVCGAFTMNNLKDGGSYTLAVQGITSGMCTFAASGVTFVFHPANTPVTMDAVYSFLRMGSTVYVSWMTEFQ